MTKDEALSYVGNYAKVRTLGPHMAQEVIDALATSIRDIETALAAELTYRDKLELRVQQAGEALALITDEMNRTLAEADCHRHDADSLAVQVADTEAALESAMRWAGMHAQICADGETREGQL